MENCAYERSLILHLGPVSGLTSFMSNHVQTKEPL